MILGSGKRYYVEPNYAYNGRISSGIYLWKKYPNHSFILTGIKYGDYYNEPFEMKTDLLNAGIPDSILISDSTSYDTFDSIKWFKKNFDQQKVVIISQREHLQRALWLAQEVGISALGYEAENIPSIGFVDYTFREIISCMKARIEVGIYKTKCLVSKQ
jgi:SanA protein